MRETGSPSRWCACLRRVLAVPLITALVAGDIVATEDQNGTLKTILTRSVERWQVFAGKTLAALTYAVAVLVLYVGSRYCRRAGFGLRPGDLAVGHGVAPATGCC